MLPSLGLYLLPDYPELTPPPRLGQKAWVLIGPQGELKPVSHLLQLCLPHRVRPVPGGLYYPHLPLLVSGTETGLERSEAQHVPQCPDSLTGGRCSPRPPSSSQSLDFLLGLFVYILPLSGETNQIQETTATLTWRSSFFFFFFLTFESGSLITQASLKLII